VRKGLLVVVGAYVAVAGGTRVAEALGARCCGCPEDCWCRRPGVSLFRWVFPWRHKLLEPETQGEVEHAAAGGLR
jgi:hypothetical protein